MRSLLAVLLGMLLCAYGLAQERMASVHLDDGRVLNGRVVAMDLASLQLQVNGEVVTIRASHIASCHFEPQAEVPAVEAAEAAPVPAQQPTVGAAVRRTAPPRPPAAAATPSVPEVADDEPESLPHDLRHRSRWRQRIEAFDAAYPWLSPAAPTQWISLGLLLFAGLSLMCHLSVKVSGAEDPSFGRCMGLAVWFLASGILQVAWVPSGSLAVAIMLLANPAFALFWMRTLFGMTRPATIVALAVQLGFAAVGFGVLVLVDALLASLGSSPT